MKLNRYFRIFLLNFQDVFEQRGRSFVWFLYSVIPTGVFLLFWIGAVSTTKSNLSGWTLSTVTSYYFLLLVASSMLIAHIEEDIAFEDIQEGHLTNYLIRPFSYFWAKFFLELPWRILQGSFGIAICIIFVLFFGTFFTVSQDPITLILSIVIMVAGFMVSFIFKMILGLTALWLTDARGLFQLFEAVMVVLGGFVVPIALLPSVVETIANLLPFSYMAYYPVVAFQGQLELARLIQVIVIQLMWITVLSGVYQMVWSRGLRRFTAVGR